MGAGFCIVSRLTNAASARPPPPRVVGGTWSVDRVGVVLSVQVKVLVPNSTAGMIIGKSGNYIKQIKEESGAYVQISQKSKETNLPERCVTIAGEFFSLFILFRWGGGFWNQCVHPRMSHLCPEDIF